jgi:hypothetical protein
MPFKPLALILAGLFLFSGCIVSTTKRKVRAGRRIVAHVHTAATAKDKKTATLQAAIAIALTAKEIMETRPFSEAFFRYRDGDSAGAATAFCQGLMRNKVKNPAIVLGAMAAITLVGERNQLQWKRFLNLMWYESKHCARHYVRE